MHACVRACVCPCFRNQCLKSAQGWSTFGKGWSRKVKEGQWGLESVKGEKEGSCGVKVANGVKKKVKIGDQMFFCLSRC